MNSRRRLLLQVLVAVACLALAGPLARSLDLAQATGVATLASLASVVISARLGWHQGLAGGVALALLSVPAMLSQGHPLAATLVLTLAAAGLGVSARWQLQPVYWLLVVSLCMALFTLRLPSPPAAADLARLATLLFLCCSTSALAEGLLVPRTEAATGPIFSVQHSWRRSLGYGLLLAVCAAITTPIALQQHWHMTGLWLILTPFLVLRPSVGDGWRVALHRALGTLAGVLLVVLMARFLPQAWPLQPAAITLAVTTALIAARHGHPALMLMGLTATIVLFNSTPADLVLMADRRLQATAIGIGITLAVMALAHPLEQRLMRRSTG